MGTRIGRTKASNMSNRSTPPHLLIPSTLAILPLTTGILFPKLVVTVPINSRQSLELLKNIILEAEDHILGLEKGKERYLREVLSLSKAYSLAKSCDEAKEIAVEVAFFQAVRARLAKFDTQVSGQQRRDFEGVVKNMVDAAVASDGIVNLIDQANLEKPTVSIFSEDFMNEVRNMMKNSQEM